MSATLSYRYQSYDQLRNDPFKFRRNAELYKFFNEDVICKMNQR